MADNVITRSIARIKEAISQVKAKKEGQEVPKEEPKPITIDPPAANTVPLEVPETVDTEVIDVENPKSFVKKTTDWFKKKFKFEKKDNSDDDDDFGPEKQREFWEKNMRDG